MRHFPPKVGISLLIYGAICHYECDLQVVLMGHWYVGEFFDGEPLPVAPSQVARACRGEKK